ncbi:MAG: hypothetical protein J1F32_01535 [Erysipelotrichales bacterium]|nr:hypothetical protein [Erysipelotrichales bacterium]
MIKKFLLVFLALSYISPNSKSNRFKDIYITPISDDIVINFSYVVGTTSDVRFSIFIEYPDSLPIYLYTNTVSIVFNYSDSFPLFKRHLKDDASLIFKANSINGSSYLRFDLKSQNETYDLLEQRYFYLEDAVQYLSDREIINYANETIEFNELNHNLDLSLPYLFYDHIYFSQDSYFFQDELQFDEITMEIMDKNNIFPLLTHKEDTVIINLELEKKNNMYYLSLLDKLYVYNDTLILSNSPKDGFVRTNYLYIPKNCLEEQFDITIKFKSLGLQKINCYYNYILWRNKKFVGSCSSSLNCVRISESNDYFDTNMSEVFV